MGDTLYILRKKKKKKIKKILLTQFGFPLAYETEKEMIFKNDEMLIECRNMYICIFKFIETPEANEKVKKIVNMIS